jgi:Integrase zinc binding domain
LYVLSMEIHKYKLLKEAILRENHATPQAGHVGRTKLLEAVQRYYWWPTVREEVEDYVRTCEQCQRNKAGTQLQAGLLQPLPIPERRWESISMDFITELPMTGKGHDAILVVVDRLSKYAHFIPTNTTVTAENLAIFV